MTFPRLMVMVVEGVAPQVQVQTAAGTDGTAAIGIVAVIVSGNETETGTETEPGGNRNSHTRTFLGERTHVDDSLGTWLAGWGRGWGRG